MKAELVDVAALNLDLGMIDPRSPRTEEELRKLARRLVPAALMVLGERRGEKTWNDLEKDSTRSQTPRSHHTLTDKKSFVREAGQNYSRQAPAKDRTTLEEKIFVYLQATQATGQP